MTQAPSTDVSIFLAAGKPFETALIALSAAESLTDDVAVDLLGVADVERADVLVRALHVCDFVVERNSEWNLAPGRGPTSRSSWRCGRRCSGRRTRGCSTSPAAAPPATV
jgi:hypothetical protein